MDEPVRMSMLSVNGETCNRAWRAVVGALKGGDYALIKDPDLFLGCLLVSVYTAQRLRIGEDQMRDLAGELYRYFEAEDKSPLRVRES